MRAFGAPVDLSKQRMDESELWKDSSGPNDIGSQGRLLGSRSVDVTHAG
jgi:hypothetical protein